MKKNLTELVFILDKSGSMHGLEADTVGGFNSVIDDQRKGGCEALVSTVLFSNNSEVLHDRVPMDMIAPLTEREYRVGGCTALVDAIGDAVKHISSVHKYIREEDVPEKTMFVIITDGMENASHKWASTDVKKLIEDKKEQGWEFLFLGANIDAVETARHFGIDENRSANYRSDNAGTRRAYEAVSQAVCCCMKSEVMPEDWADGLMDGTDKPARKPRRAQPDNTAK